MLHLGDYLRSEKPDVMGITETRLVGNVDTFNIGDGEYNVWLRNRDNKQGVGVMLLIKKSGWLRKLHMMKGKREY